MVAPSFVIYRDRGHTSGSGAGGKGPSLAKTLQPSFASLGTTADYIQWLFPDNNHHGSSRLRRYRLSNISARSRDTGRRTTFGVTWGRYISNVQPAHHVSLECSSCIVLVEMYASQDGRIRNEPRRLLPREQSLHVFVGCFPAKRLTTPGLGERRTFPIRGTRYDRDTTF